MSDNLNVFAVVQHDTGAMHVYLISLSVCVDSTYKQSKRQQVDHLCALC